MALGPQDIIPNLANKGQDLLYRLLFRNFDIIKNNLGGTVALGTTTYSGTFTEHSGKIVTVENGVVVKVE